MKPDHSVLPADKTDRAILMIRGYRIMLDSDLADLYQVPTKQLNQQVKRNIDRFPEDFMFQLTDKEKTEVVTNCDHLRKLKFSPHLPYAFTEHGAVMLAGILNSHTAVQASIHVVRAFVKLRALLATHQELARKLDSMEQKYDKQFKVVFDALRELMSTPSPTRKAIGYRIHPKQEKKG
ncbi:MAG: ORF6N domain-containing protein [Flavobacteriales bacterium]|nr:ORF6N domain-containing protein [Flavobacteriales bacterium]